MLLPLDATQKHFTNYCAHIAEGSPAESWFFVDESGAVGSSKTIFESARGHSVALNAGALEWAKAKGVGVRYKELCAMLDDDRYTNKLAIIKLRHDLFFSLSDPNIPSAYSSSKSVIDAVFEDD